LNAIFDEDKLDFNPVKGRRIVQSFNVTGLENARLYTTILEFRLRLKLSVSLTAIPEGSRNHFQGVISIVESHPGKVLFVISKPRLEGRIRLMGDCRTEDHFGYTKTRLKPMGNEIGSTQNYSG
jgi:hypothetical protein